MGFCLFNNVAIATKYALANYKLERILIVDFDVHHGNGTQAAFYDNPKVLYISTHQYPFYPGTGSVEETGEGDGVGRTVNVPLPGGCTDGDYLEAFERVVLPVAREFDPGFVLMSAGYDAHGVDASAALVRIARRTAPGAPVPSWSCSTPPRVRPRSLTPWFGSKSSWRWLPRSESRRSMRASSLNP